MWYYNHHHIFISFDFGGLMVSVMYSLVAFMGALIVLILLNYNAPNEDRAGNSFKTTMLFVLVFMAIDGIWGLAASHFITNSYLFLYIISMLFHASLLCSAVAWFTFSYRYLNVDIGPIGKTIIVTPAVAGMTILILNITQNWIFYIDDAGIYSSGSMRIVLFSIEYLYFLTVVVTTVFFLIKERDAYRRYRYNTVLMFGIVPVLCGVAQFYYPDAPLFTCGYTISSLFIFIGILSADRAKEQEDTSDFYKEESKETFKAFAGIANGFVSIHIINLLTNTQRPVKSNEYVDSFIRPEDGFDVQIKKAVEGVASSDTRDKLLEFVDLNTLSDRMKGKRSISCEFVEKNQGWCIANFIKLEEDKSERVLKCIFAVQNINEGKLREEQYERALREAHEDKNFIYSEMLQMQPVGVMATDGDNHIFTMNDAAARLFGYFSANQATGDFKDILSRVKLEDEEKAWERYNSFKESGEGYTYYMKTKTYSGREAYVMAVPKLIKLKNGTLSIITTFTDISRNKEVENKLIELSETDALTGINNRGSGEAKIDQMLRRGCEGFFCMMDINKFKKINDTYGHDVGDKVLQIVADCLKTCFRDKDVVMRLGGDEFVVFAENIIGLDDAKRCITRLFETLASMRIPEMGEETVTISLGASIALASQGKDFDTIYKEADSVMYRVKDLPGSNYAFYP